MSAPIKRLEIEFSNATFVVPYKGHDVKITYRQQQSSPNPWFEIQGDPWGLSENDCDTLIEWLEQNLDVKVEFLFAPKGKPSSVADAMWAVFRNHARHVVEAK